MDIGNERLVVDESVVLGMTLGITSKTAYNLYASVHIANLVQTLYSMTDLLRLSYRMKTGAILDVKGG